MLERTALLVCPHAEGWRIFEPESGRILGSARRQTERGVFGVEWFARPRLAVFEAGDEPLVFTVRKHWGFSHRWAVHDADDNPVAILRRGCIQDPYGQSWAVVEKCADEIRFQNVDREIALARRTEDGLHLTFASELQGNPLIKMSVLGAILLSEFW